MRTIWVLLVTNLGYMNRGGLCNGNGHDNDNDDDNNGY